MSGYYYNEELAVVYKVGPVAASLVKDKNENGQEVILVHTTIKMTNFKREKVRRTISEVYSTADYDEETAKKDFIDRILPRVLGKAAAISEKEYKSLEKRLEHA